jgi:hypothetical protein
MANIDKLQTIKEIIETMNKCYQVEILKILTDDSSVIVSENNNGTFVNLSNLDNCVINKLETYIEYVNKQQSNLRYIEDEKANIKNEFFKQDKRNSKIKKNKVVEIGETS